MFFTLGPRWPGAHYGLILAGVQMPPLPFPLMVIQLAVRAAFRAGPTRYLTVLQINVHFAVSQLQFNSFHQPGRFDSQNLSIKFPILHALIVASQHLAHYKAGIPEFSGPVSVTSTLACGLAPITPLTTKWAWPWGVMKEYN
jgi:hypothetical protein